MQGAAGVFTYYMLDKNLTLAVMFIWEHLMNNYPPNLGFYNVKVYLGHIKTNRDLYKNMTNDKPYKANDQWQLMTNVGSGFTGRGKVSISDTPTLEIVIEMPPSKRTKE